MERKTNKWAFVLNLDIARNPDQFFQARSGDKFDYDFTKKCNQTFAKFLSVLHMNLATLFSPSGFQKS